MRATDTALSHVVISTPRSGGGETCFKESTGRFLVAPLLGMTKRRGHGTTRRNIKKHWDSGRPKTFLRASVVKSPYSPPTVSPSMRMVGDATEPRNSRSLPISEMLRNMSFRFPATVISSTGYVSPPPKIHIPDAPRE